MHIDGRIIVDREIVTKESAPVPLHQSAKGC